MSEITADPKELERIRELGFALEWIESDSGEERLALRDLQDEKLQPLEVDFISGAMLHRLKHGLAKGQPFSKALGIKSLDPEKAPTVFDATAGLGVDAFFAAALGCSVRAVERTPTLASLLDDGYSRLVTFAEIEEEETAGTRLREIADRLSFELGDSARILNAMTEEERPDVVYLDPMYPEEGRSSRALPKKTMQMFRRLIGADQDAADVLAAARRVARSRVVVKRPLHAPPLGEGVTHSFEGKTARYDAYIVTRPAIQPDS